jgi:hypothetical protein
MGLFVICTLSVFILVFLTMVCVQVIKMEKAVVDITAYAEEKATEMYKRH